MAKIIAICGFIGSGKDTVADYLVNVYGFRRESFANSLKDAVAAVFDWDRTLLEGRTKQAREWREQVDPWWAERLNMPDLTPRWVLQYFGTEVVRKAFHDQMWVASLENRLRNSTDDIVITDCRFPNEISIIKRLGGQVIRVHRGAEPDWYDVAVQAHAGLESAKTKLAEYNIHASETAWVGSNFDAVLNNNGSMDELYSQLEQLLKNQALGHPGANLIHLERSQSDN